MTRKLVLVASPAEGPEANTEASSNGRTTDFGSVYEGSNPSASASSPGEDGDALKPARLPEWVLLVPLGGVPGRQLADVAQGVREVLGIPCRAGPSLDRPGYALNEARGQYHASSILRRLGALRPRAGGVPVLGVVDVDLFLPDAPYVLGDADRDAGAALLSTVRLAGEPGALRRRLQVEALHVLGQLLGLSDCLDHRCIMFSARDALDADRKSMVLCGGCLASLGNRPMPRDEG